MAYNFILDFYQHTGWIPAWPLEQCLALGDVCQLQDGRLSKLVNCSHLPLVESIDFSSSIKLDEHLWQVLNGVNQQHSSSEHLLGEQGQVQVVSSQSLGFAQPGAFIFSAKDPKAHFILNWSAVNKDIALKLVQLHFSLRQAFVITRLAQVHHWALAIAAQADAQLDTLSDSLDCNPFSLLGHSSTRATLARNMRQVQTVCDRPAYFFQAKKLVLSARAEDTILRHLLDQPSQLATATFANYPQMDAAEFFRNSDLSLNTAMELYSWANFGLDDVALMAKRL